MDEWCYVRCPLNCVLHDLLSTPSPPPLSNVKLIIYRTTNRYLKHIDTYPPTAAHISAFLTPSGARFLLLHQPPQLPSSSSSLAASMSSSALGGGSSSRASSTSIAANPTSPQTEEAIRQFLNEVYENYVKTVMSPFYKQGTEIRSPVFRSRVAAAGRKWL